MSAVFFWLFVLVWIVGGILYLHLAFMTIVKKPDALKRKIASWSPPRRLALFILIAIASVACMCTWPAFATVTLFKENEYRS